MNNQQTNIEICTKLLEWFSKEENKEQRFMQGLFNLNITDFSSETLYNISRGFNKINTLRDRYDESSKVTLNRLKI